MGFILKVAAMFLVLLNLIHSPAAAAARKGPVLPAIFSFGDSQLDAGNNNYIANSSSRVNFPPYGETYFHKPTGRFSNGRTMADFIALAVGLPLLHPSLEPNISFSKGVNFASGGSGFLDSTSAGAGVLPMSAQLHQFHMVFNTLNQQLGAASAAKLISESLFIITSGSNDLGINYMQNTTLQQKVKPQDFVNGLMEEYKKAILTFHEHGVRRLAVFELGVLGCTPYSRYLASSLQNGTGCLNQINQLGLLFNANLRQLLNQLRPQLPDMKIAFGKTFSIFTTIMNNAKAYGFETTTSACCGAGPFNAVIPCGKPVPSNYPYKPFTGKYPSKFLFWDNTHPTEAAYFLVFKELWNGGTDSIEPFNLGQLVSMH